MEIHNSTEIHVLIYVICFRLKNWDYLKSVFKKNAIHKSDII